ncbi:hemicentin-2-like [Ornithodoros turicata]|uniref:hemicentin-2-like n=1 Tax=Ornithodoros turicata TaxID=34597 RepID=UPI00313A3744
MPRTITMLRNLLLVLLGGSVVRLSAGTVAYYGQTRVREGDSFLISCVTGNSTVVRWMKDGWPIKSTPLNKYVFEESHEQTAKVNKLYVAHSKRRHAGDYTCVNNTRTYHHLHVEPREVERQVQHVTCFNLDVSKPLEIPCEHPGFKDNSNLTWYKNDEFFHPENRRVHFRANKLIINPAQLSDVGVYTCLDADHANRTSGRASYLFQYTQVVRVVLPIVIESLPRYHVVDEGLDFNISCNILSRPPPRVSWYAGGDLVDPLSSSPRILLSPGERSIPDTLLTIRNVTIRDKKRYSCHAAHDGCDSNAVHVSTVLYVQLQKIHTNEAQPGGGLVIYPDDPFLLISCIHTDNATVFIWKKDGADFVASDPQTSIFANGTIRIGNPDARDAGNYTCDVNGTADSATIEVRYKVTIVQEPSQTTASSAWLEGRDIRIAVKVTGVPAPTLSWQKDGKELITDDRHVLEDYMNVTSAILKIIKLREEDRGNYTCVASNGRDEDTLSVYVRVKGKYAALIPFLGICIEVITLCIIIYIAENRAARQGNEPAEPSEHSRRDGDSSEENPPPVEPPIFSPRAELDVGTSTAPTSASGGIPEVEVQRPSAIVTPGEDNKKEV